MPKRKTKDYEYRVVARKPGRPGGRAYGFTEFRKALRAYQECVSQGYIVTMKQREVGEWEEIRNPCEEVE